MAEQDQVFDRCAWRLIAFMGLLYRVSFLDRVNVGFAALTIFQRSTFGASIRSGVHAIAGMRS